ncbi:MAG: hypothetical protein WD556_11540 [Actinomycetota bacterium]
MSNEESGSSALARYDAKQFNVLHPVMLLNEDPERTASSLLVQSVSVVQIQAGKDSPDVYNDFRYANQRDGKYALSALGLAKISSAAGIKWIPELCQVVDGPKPVQSSDGLNHTYIRYRAAGALRQPNGEWHVETAEKDIDTSLVADKLRDSDRRTWKRTAGSDGAPAWVKRAGKDETKVASEIEDRVRQQILQLREFLLGHAETKAKNRVIRRILSMQQTYGQQDLAKPFVVPRLVYRPDMTDPRQLEQVQIEGRRASDELYGQASPAPAGEEHGAASSVVSSGTSGPAAGGGTHGGRPRDEEGAAEPARTGPPAGAGSASTAPAGGPVRPKQNPVIEGGEYDGKRWSELAEEDPGYLKGIATATRSKVKERLALDWVAWAQQPLVDDTPEAEQPTLDGA